MTSRPARGADRTAEVAAAALGCFSEGGYRLTQIAHVADRMGVSVGTIYRYVETKEALFHLAVLQALDRLADAPPLPVSATGFDTAVAAISNQIDRDRLWPILQGALSADTPADPKAEARAIAGELFDAMADRAAIIRLLDRCARDVPPLAELFDRRVRVRLMEDLLAWVTSRRLTPSSDRAAAEALARGAMEAVAWLAKNRPGDATAQHIDARHARAAAVQIFANAFQAAN